MDSTPINLPSSTGYEKQYRIVCCAPFYHKPFTWSRSYRAGYNTLYELDLPKNSGFPDLSPVAQADCETKLLWYAHKYIERAWRRKKDW